MNAIWMSQMMFAANSILASAKKIFVRFNYIHTFTHMPVTHRSPHKPKKPKKKHISLQMLPPRAFHPTLMCMRSVGTSATKRLRKTPGTNAKKCLGSVHIGQDGKFVYIAVATRQKNPRYTSSKVSGIGSHITARWEKVYSQKTGKPLKVADLPPSFVLPM